MGTGLENFLYWALCVILVMIGYHAGYKSGVVSGRILEKIAQEDREKKENGEQK